MFKGRLEQNNIGVKADDEYAEMDPTSRYGRFEVVLGKGAMKTVFKAMDEVLGMEVAWNQVKLNDLFRSPEDLQRLYSEVHILSTLNHHSIIRFYTSWIDVHRRTFNFITEMFTSGSLREYRKRYKRLDIRAVKVWARQILAGLVYLHEHNPPIIHRDLKCDNIFVNGHLGQVKIGDLGLATILRGSQNAHSVIGTPEFMAPELYEENYNELVDVYSFGMCVLEMLTSEYPYSECINPAQIYKKVTSGKLPAAFYKVQDLEAQRFIGKCLETASKRMSAQELLLDPFLALDEYELLPVTMMGNQKPFLNDDLKIEELQLSEDYPPRTNMNITGKLNPEDDTIFLKVQIADKQGSVRNVYFPFDILSDTSIAVATEMVKELEITDWKPFEIADMIDGEITAVLPHWSQPHDKFDQYCHILNYLEEDDGHYHPFYSLSSSSSSPVSPSGLFNSHGTSNRTHGCHWLQDDLFDDTSSQSSITSEKYSNLNYYYSGEEHHIDTGPVRSNQRPGTAITHNSTRFCPEENCSTSRQSMARNCDKHSKVLLDSHRLERNRSLVDTRSRLLHRSLVEEVNKRRLFKTVGAVEDIGFRAPCQVTRKASPAVTVAGTCSVRTRSTDGKRQGNKGRRV